MTPNPPPATQVESADVLIDRLLPLPFHSVPSRQQARNAIRARDLALRADERRKVLDEMHDEIEQWIKQGDWDKDSLRCFADSFRVQSLAKGPA